MQRMSAFGMAVVLLVTSLVRAEAPSAAAFEQRGYYVTFMRMPTYGLDAWKQILDGIRDDGGNLLILWMGGGFRSEKYPVTWQYNQEHRNIRQDFARELIDESHGRGIKVLLGFTPFGYDGVNQYSLERPELRATNKEGQPAAKFGIHCWGFNLCPSQPESQRFMLNYAREMAFDFYPNADGLMIESSDYAICHCPKCGQRFFEQEFQFVRQISQEMWAKKPEATVMVYPHYFSGKTVPGFDVPAAKLPFDPRWTLFFTPHSAHLDSDLIKQAKHSVWWDDSPARGKPADIRAAVIRAQTAGMTGYIPSFEAFTFVANEAEEGQAWLKGKRQVPLGFGWLPANAPPYDELPLRPNRIAFREFTRHPHLSMDDFKKIVAREVFGDEAQLEQVDDLLTLQAIFTDERTWCQPSPVTSPERVRSLVAVGQLGKEKKAEYQAGLKTIEALAAKYRAAPSGNERELYRIARWILDQWDEEARRLLAPSP